MFKSVHNGWGLWRHMATAWNDAATNAQKLTVYAAASITGGSWKVMLEKAISEFNALAKKNSINVILEKSKDPPKDDGSGADINVEAAAGSITPSWAGKSSSSMVFSGIRLHGHTTQFKQEGKIQKAFVYLPSTPKINTPKALRAAGEGVLKVIAVHELVHACGLDDGDHTTDDLFQGYPDVDYGSTPSGDRVLIPGGSMPPLKFGGTTIQKLKGIWP